MNFVGGAGTTGVLLTLTLLLSATSSPIDPASPANPANPAATTTATTAAAATATTAIATSTPAAGKAWWQWGASPYPLEVPRDLARRATPIWAPNVTLAPNTTCKVGTLPGGAPGACAAWPQFVLARTEFRLPAKSLPLRHAVAFVTAQQSEFCPPDQIMDGWHGSRHLELGDYGSCIYPGGTTQPKLLGAFKLSINGVLVGMGPGRRVNQTQGVDALDVTSALVPGGNCVALQGFHTNRWGARPRLLLLMRLTFVRHFPAQFSPF